MRKTALFLALVAQLIISSLAFADTSAPSQVYLEVPIGSVKVGFDKKANRWAYRKVLLGVIGPAGLKSFETKNPSKCLSYSLDTTAEALAKQLDYGIKPFPTIIERLQKQTDETNKKAVAQALADKNPTPVLKAVTAEDVKNAQVTALQSINMVIGGITTTFQANMNECLVHKADVPVDQLEVGVVTRDCSLKGACAGTEFESSGNEEAMARFSKIWEWSSAVAYTVPGKWMSIGVGGSSSVWSGDIVELPGQTQYEKVQTDLAAGYQRFAEGADKLRDAETKFDYLVPALMRVPTVEGLHFLDVVASPARAIAALNIPLPDGQKITTAVAGAAAQQYTEVATQVFKKFNDELARTRILECAKFQGTAADNISACTGYKLDPLIVTNCLAGKDCRPDFGANINAAVLALTQPVDLAQLVDAAQLPRLHLTGNLGEIEASARQCQDLNPNDNSGATMCLMNARLNDKDRATLACAKAAVDGGVAKFPTSCLTNVIDDPVAKAMTACITGGTDLKKGMACAAASALGPDGSAALECMKAYTTSKDKTAALACMTKDKLGVDGQIVASCLTKSTKWQDTTACVLKEKLPPDAQKLVTCATSSTSGAGGVASCYLAANMPTLPGDLGKLANCAASSQGDVTGTALCMVGPKLTPEQQIMLSCLSSSGDPSTYAACVGGQLAMKEFIQCQGKKAGDGPCFGENNEIRKFLRNVTGMDITSNTVVGQALNLQLDVVKAQVAFAESAGKFLQQAGDATLKFAQWQVDTVNTVVTTVGKAADQVRQELCRKTTCVAGIPTPVPSARVDSTGGELKFPGGSVGWKW